MNQSELLQHLINVLESLDIRYMVVGSFASSAYGEPRLTQDIDIVVDMEREDVERVCLAFPASQFYVSPEAALDAVIRRGQFNVIHPASGTKIDFLLARHDAWGRAQLARRQKVEVLRGHEGYMARPEDIILSKMQYYQAGGSEKHLRDIAGILKISGPEVDRAYVSKWAESLGLAEVWAAILRGMDQKTP